MPNSPNAKKALRQSQKRRLHNRSQKSSLRTAVKKVRALAAAGNVEEAEAAFRIATKALDQSASKHLIHRNAAARTKSRLSKLILKAKNPAPTAEAAS